ncbi:MAG: BglII/BstYI family type II restriction endonuclease [Pseudomonadota bacterium]
MEDESKAESFSLLSARDSDDFNDVFPSGFSDLYEIYSYRNAARILATACKSDFDEIVGRLIDFRIETDLVVRPGRNKSDIAKKIENAFNPIGWIETRIRGDLHIEKQYSQVVERQLKSGPNKGSTVFKRMPATAKFKLLGVLDGHKVDFVKNRVALDFEWNSKDQTFDRDLYAMRAFYECGIISSGVLITRSSELAPLFREISSRVEVKDFKSKFGASTTWMGKLTYRLDAGRAGGCPILALGIRPSVISDFAQWKRANPVIRAPEFDLSDEEEIEDE